MTQFQTSGTGYFQVINLIVTRLNMTARLINADNRDEYPPDIDATLPDRGIFSFEFS
jgi:hypothetical protein